MLPLKIILAVIFSSYLLNVNSHKETRKVIITTVSFYGEIKKNPLLETKSISSTHCVHLSVRRHGCNAAVYKDDSNERGICILYDSIEQNDIKVDKTGENASKVMVFLQVPKSCKEVFETHVPIKSGIYYLRGLGRHYCKMNMNHCSNGGWTLALKIDGDKGTFLYKSKYWTNTSTYNEDKCLEDIYSKEEGKFQAYMSLPFRKICLEMRLGSAIQGIELSVQDQSLLDLFKKEIYIRTYAGRNAWASLVPNRNLQDGCNKEGISVLSLDLGARLGIIANNEPDCMSVDTIIGIGLQYTSCFGIVMSSGNIMNCHIPPTKIPTISTVYIM